MVVVLFVRFPGPEVADRLTVPDAVEEKSHPGMTVGEEESPHTGGDAGEEGLTEKDIPAGPGVGVEGESPSDSDLTAAPDAKTFREWLARDEPANAKDREDWLAQGVAVAKARRPRMREWIQEDPGRAVREGVTPRMFAALPREIQELVERPVAGEGFFGVMAVCNHGAGEEHVGSCEIRHEVVFGFGTKEAEAYKAGVYGERLEKMTVEEDSIYGVILDDRIALHEHEVVVVDDGEGAPGGRFAVYFRGRVRYADTLGEAERISEEF